MHGFPGEFHAYLKVTGGVTCGNLRLTGGDAGVAAARSREDPAAGGDRCSLARWLRQKRSWTGGSPVALAPPVEPRGAGRADRPAAVEEPLRGGRTGGSDGAFPVTLARREVPRESGCLFASGFS